jgi:hypothetical protein
MPVPTRSELSRRLDEAQDALPDLDPIDDATPPDPIDMRVIQYPVENYPRDNQQPVEGVRLARTQKNYDDLDTWSGVLVGPRHLVVATLMDWGHPVIHLDMEEVDEARANELVDEYDGYDAGLDAGEEGDFGDG